MKAMKLVTYHVSSRTRIHLSIDGVFHEVVLQTGEDYCFNCGNIYSFSRTHRCCDCAILPFHLRARPTYDCGPGRSGT
jgi:hypothetical protein